VNATNKRAIYILILLIATDFAFESVKILRYFGWGDFRAYYSAAQTAARGGEIYDYEQLNKTWQAVGDPALSNYTHGYVYPPLFANLLRPLTAFTVQNAARAWFLLNALTWLATLAMLLRYLGIGVTTTLGLAMIGLGLRFEPALHTFIAGQLNVLVFALIMVCLLSRRSNQALSGTALAGAIVLKVNPAALGLYFLIRKEYRILLWAGVSGVALTLASILISGWGTNVTFVTQVLPALSKGTANPYNQSLAGATLRAVNALGLSWSAPAIALARVLGFALLGDAVRRIWANRSDPDELADLSLLILAVSIASPITWSHHLVWAILPVLYLFLTFDLGSVFSSKSVTSIAVLLILVELNDFYVHPFFEAGPLFWFASIKLFALGWLYAYVASNYGKPRLVSC
jgi:hypothetical protein